MARKKEEPKSYAGRYPGATPVKQADGWTEWTEPGQEVVGVFRKLESFRNGMKTTILTEKGPVVFSTPKMLQTLLEEIDPGTKVAIVYTGRGKDTGKGEAMKIFEVYALPN